VLTLLFSTLLVSQGSLLDYAATKWRVDSHVRIEDAYKWLVQATRGGEHAAPDAQSAREWLKREWEALGEPWADEPVWESLRPDGKVGRLNLRPFRACGGRMEDVLTAFLESAKAFKGDEADFRSAWYSLGRQLKQQPLGRLTSDEWQRLDRMMSARRFPPVHHSATYQQARQPAYRVLTGDAAHRIIGAACESLDRT
jgi:hypothetical protein